MATFEPTLAVIMIGIGQMFTVVKGKILKNDLTRWSHCSCLISQPCYSSQLVRWSVNARILVSPVLYPWFFSMAADRLQTRPSCRITTTDHRDDLNKENILTFEWFLAVHFYRIRKNKCHQFCNCWPRILKHIFRLSAQASSIWFVSCKTCCRVVRSPTKLMQCVNFNFDKYYQMCPFLICQGNHIIVIIWSRFWIVDCFTVFVWSPIDGN